jgi:hypothetical protein
MELVKLQPLGRLSLTFVQEWTESKNMGAVYLLGPERNLWKETKPHELLALKRKEQDDLLSTWLTKLVRSWLHPAFGRFFKVSISNRVGWQ